MEVGFRERPDAVVGLLSDDDTAFVLVASPRRDPIADARYFAEQLAEAANSLRALNVNRMHPSFVEGMAAATRERPETRGGTDPGSLLTQPAGLTPVTTPQTEHTT